MNRAILSLVSGVALGALSWAIVPLVSNKFEPFDTEIGFYLGQAILSATAFYVGFSQGLKPVFVLIVGIYVGGNLYAYTFGSGEARAYALLGLITHWALCVYPLLAGVLGKLAKFGVTKYNLLVKRTP
jgi:hypothetical protein